MLRARVHAVAERELVRMRAAPSIRVLIVDDNAVFLNHLEKWFAARPEFDLVGKAYSGMDAVEQSTLLCPDLVVMDVAMPLMNGYEAAAKMTEGHHHPVVILISFFDLHDAQPGGRSIAHAFIRKDSLYEELIPTVARLFPLWWDAAADKSSTEERRSHGVQPMQRLDGF